MLNSDQALCGFQPHFGLCNCQRQTTLAFFPWTRLEGPLSKESQCGEEEVPVFKLFIFCALNCTGFPLGAKGYSPLGATDWFPVEAMDWFHMEARNW